MSAHYSSELSDYGKKNSYVAVDLHREKYRGGLQLTALRQLPRTRPIEKVADEPLGAKIFGAVVFVAFVVAMIYIGLSLR